jgi:hypothetical protein
VLIKQIKKLKPEEQRGIKLGIEAICLTRHQAATICLTPRFALQAICLTPYL